MQNIERGKTAKAVGKNRKKQEKRQKPAKQTGRQAEKLHNGRHGEKRRK